MGAQGGRPADLRAVFGDDLSAVLPSYSREVLAEGPTVARLRAAVDRILDDCRRAVEPIG
jgi:orotidine-5'-phosphate decarboxylase